MKFTGSKWYMGRLELCFVPGDLIVLSVDNKVFSPRDPDLINNIKIDTVTSAPWRRWFTRDRATYEITQSRDRERYFAWLGNKAHTAYDSTLNLHISCLLRQTANEI